MIIPHFGDSEKDFVILCVLKSKCKNFFVFFLFFFVQVRKIKYQIKKKFLDINILFVMSNINTIKFFSMLEKKLLIIIIHN